MKLTHLITGLALLVPLVGCDRPDGNDTTVPTVPPTTNAAARELGREVREAVDTSKAALIEGKDQLLASTDAKLKELDQEIADLGSKVDALKDEVKVESNKALETLREKRTQLGQRFEELKTANQETWSAVKARFESAWAEFQKSYEDAKAKFRN